MSLWLEAPVPNVSPGKLLHSSPLPSVRVSSRPAFCLSPESSLETSLPPSAQTTFILVLVPGPCRHLPILLSGLAAGERARTVLIQFDF